MAADTGIALLSMYGDDEEEEETSVATKEEEAAAAWRPEDYGGEEDDEKKNDYTPQSFLYKSPQIFPSPSPLRSQDEANFKTLRSPFPQQTFTPHPPTSRSQLSPPFNLASPSPSPAPVPPPSIQEHPVSILELPDGQRPRRSALAIVDYAQDEAAMSPDAEVLEIENYGRVVFGAELHVSELSGANGYINHIDLLCASGNVEGTTPVTSQSRTPNSQEPHPPSDAHEQSKSEASIAMDFSGTEAELVEVKASPTVSTDMQIDKSLQSFLPPAVTAKCSEELQEKINKFLTYKRAGKSFNADLRNRKDYRNPNFLQHAVSYQDIDETGTCFSKEVFDPHGYDKCDYYDEIEADMKRELERKEQERKKTQKIELVSGGTQQPMGVAPPLKMNAPSPASGAPTLPNSSLPPNPSIGDDASKDGRTNKKSKWDKVDGDTKMASGGQDNNPPGVNVHAAHLSAANAGAGYSAFAQLKRKEAEERKSGERKFDKRS